MQRHGYYLAIMFPQWDINHLRGLREAEVNLILKRSFARPKCLFTNPVMEIRPFDTWFMWTAVFDLLSIGSLIDARLGCSQEVQELWCEILNDCNNYLTAYKAVVALGLIYPCLTKNYIEELEMYYHDLGNESTS